MQLGMKEMRWMVQIVTSELMKSTFWRTPEGAY